MRARVLLLLALTGATLVGCATSRGSLYRDTVAAEKSQAAKTQPERAEEPQPPTKPAEKGLRIESFPAGADVFLNNRFEGVTPLSLERLTAGRYLLRLEKDGYYPHLAWIDYTGGPLVYSTSLALITGFLQVEAHPPGARISAGDHSLSAGAVEELPVGLYELRVRLFGFEEHTELVRVSEKALTRLEVTLEAATFRLQDLRSSRSAFNPRNPGLLGKTSLRFQASSYGTGRAVILDEAGREVWQRELARFSTWEQAFAWDGRSEGGAILPDGTYTVRVEALPEEPGSAVSAEAEVRIDSTLVLAYRSLWNGASGMLFAPTPEVLPQWGMQFSTLLLAHAEASGDGYAFRVPWDLGLRLGLTSANNLELALHGGVILGYGDVVPYFLNAALKWVVLEAGKDQWLTSAALLKLGYQNVRTDSFANFSGLTLGLPTAAVFGRTTFVVAPELVLSAWEPSYLEPGWPDPSFTAWAYLKGGLLLDLDPWTVGFSVAARTLPFDRGLGLALPVQGGVEVHWLIPGTQLFLSGAVSAEARAVNSWYFSGGAGLGLVN